MEGTVGLIKGNIPRHSSRMYFHCILHFLKKEVDYFTKTPLLSFPFPCEGSQGSTGGEGTLSKNSPHKLSLPDFSIGYTYSKY